MRPAPDFTLTDQYSRRWTLSHPRGSVVVLFFGFTHCADTCPTTVAKLTRAIAGQSSGAKNAEIVFVTIDPQRDTPPVLAHFIARFGGARIVGLTGTPGQIALLERAYAV